MKTLPHTYHAPQLDEPSKDARMLDEVIVVSRLESPAVETPEIGAKKITIEDVRNTPVLLGENDVIKTIRPSPVLSKAPKVLQVCTCTVAMPTKTYSCLIMYLYIK